MSLPVTLDQLFAFEYNLETAFVACMVAQSITPAPQPSRNLTVFSTPYIEVRFDNGAAILENQHPVAGFVGRQLPFNSYDGNFSIRLATNRGSTSPVHTTLLAQIRKSLQLFNVYKNWDAQQISFPTEIRESGSSYEFDDEKLIDYTTITFYLLHSLNPAAWPTIS